jgi:ABC-type Zn uptake system ZnuABC Zn-binding protein ZnuA
MMRNLKIGDVKQLSDTYMIFYNGGSVDKIDTTIIKAMDGLEAYCTKIIDLVNGVEI